MDYYYVITTHYDGNYKSSHRYTNAVDAVEEWQKCVDWGFADEYATYNLLEPNGKMHTKNFYRNGKVTGK
jgi:hypothetical protein